MSVRENVHQLVDTLPDECLPDALDYLADLKDGDEPLNGPTKTAVEEGMEDIRRGRTISLDEYRRTRGL
jgi:hypothetical protein